MVMELIMYAMTKHYYLLCFMFVIKISQLWPGDHSKTMFVFYTFYFLWTLNHGSCGLLFERTNNISVSSFEAARNMSLQVWKKISGRPPKIMLSWTYWWYEMISTGYKHDWVCPPMSPPWERWHRGVQCLQLQQRVPVVWAGRSHLSGGSSPWWEWWRREEGESGGLLPGRGTDSNHEGDGGVGCTGHSSEDLQGRRTLLQTRLSLCSELWWLQSWIWLPGNVS